LMTLMTNFRPFSAVVHFELKNCLLTVLRLETLTVFDRDDTLDVKFLSIQGGYFLSLHAFILVANADPYRSHNSEPKSGNPVLQELNRMPRIHSVLPDVCYE
jgi:hypothetical protein